MAFYKYQQIADYINQNEAFDIINVDYNRAFENSYKTLQQHIYHYNGLAASSLANNNVLSLIVILLTLCKSLQESFKTCYLGLRSLLYTLTLCYLNYLCTCSAQVGRLLIV